MAGAPAPDQNGGPGRYPTGDGGVAPYFAEMTTRFEVTES